MRSMLYIDTYRRECFPAGAEDVRSMPQEAVVVRTVLAAGEVLEVLELLEPNPFPRAFVDLVAAMDPGAEVVRYGWM